MMRLRKGFGTVRKLTGNRRNNYAVHPPKVNGKRPKAICYTDDYHIGVCCLNAWHNGAYYPGMELDLKERRLDEVVGTYTSSTFRSVYQMYWSHRFGEGAVKEKDKDSQAAVRSAWKRMESIWFKTLDEVSIQELQGIVNETAKDYSKSTVTRVMSLIRGLYRFAFPRKLCLSSEGTPEERWRSWVFGNSLPIPAAIRSTGYWREREFRRRIGSALWDIV